MSHISTDAQTPSSAGFVTLLVFVTLAVSIACAWKLTPAAQYLSPQMIAQLFQDIRSSDWAIPSVIGIYVLSSMVFFPLTIIILATALVFPPAEACAIAFMGSISSACLGYAFGRYLGIHPEHFMAGRGGDIIARYSRNASIMSIALLRMVPLLPLGVIDVALGIARIPFPIYSLATLIGVLPSVFALSFLGSSLNGLWHSHNLHTFVYAGVGIVCCVGLVFLSHVIFRRMDIKRTLVMR